MAQGVYEADVRNERRFSRGGEMMDVIGVASRSEAIYRH
jgi:hypothetical protein